MGGQLERVAPPARELDRPPSASIATLAELFLEAARFDKAECLLSKENGRFVPVSTAELARRVGRLLHALETLGVRPGDRVALMAENGPHWPLVDFATLCLGAVLVPIYPTLLLDEVSFILRDSGARLLFVQGADRLGALRQAVGPSLPTLVSIPAPHDCRASDQHGSDETDDADEAPPAVSLAALLARGDGAPSGQLEERARAVRAADLATLIYTSGTTGTPKGVMLTHGNVVANVLAALEALGIEGRYLALSFLPLSHSFERTVDYCYFLQGCTIAYAESVQSVGEDLLLARPQVFVSVPRVYEKLRARIEQGVGAAALHRRVLFAWALRAGHRALAARVARRYPRGLAGLELRLADRLVFSRLRARLGGRFEFAISGGAPIAAEILRFFWAAGVPIYEGYGLTETSPVVSVNTPRAVKIGSVGKPLRGVETRVAGDGELLVRGPNVMQGYWNAPQPTAEVLDGEGWLYTGDIAEIDAEGFLTITDRKKELIVNAYGKNIAPAPIENLLKARSFVEQAVVLGDRRPFLAALLVPDFDAVSGWLRRKGLPPGAPEELASLPEVRELIAGEVEAVNRHLPRHEHIRAFELLPAPLSAERGELTPTLKVKRRVVQERYAALIDRLYG